MPVTTRRQAQQQIKQAHAESHTNLNNLPAEILQEIAYHLNPDAAETSSDDGSDFSDIEYDRQSVVSVEPDQGPPDVDVMPCCRAGDDESIATGAGIPILDYRSIFSAVSRRIRDVVWNRRQKRRRTIRYCDRWIQETTQLSEATRSRYT
jgi:hypothetical protein